MRPAGVSDDKAAEDFEKAHASAVEISAATTVAAERNLLIKLALKQVGKITGAVDRDVRVVLLMGQMPTQWAEILKKRAPADFADWVRRTRRGQTVTR